MRGNAKSFRIGFIIIIAIMMITMGRAFVLQEKQSKADAARYQKMVDEEGKYKLTKADLEEDHDRYVESAKEGWKLFKDLITALAGAIILFLIYGLMSVFDFASLFPTKNKSLVKGIALVIFGVIVVFSVNFFSEAIRLEGLNSKAEEAKYGFVELNIVSTRVETKRETRGTGKDRRTETRHYYYLQLDDEKEIKTNKTFFDRANNHPGIYYAGMTENGALFSLYPDTEFELGN